MQVIFLRHGKAEKAAADQKDVERKLSEIGRQQAAKRRRAFNGTSFDLVISSPAPRASETAAIVGSTPIDKVIVVPELYPDPEDGGIGSKIDELFNLPHLGYCEVGKYEREPGGEAITNWGHDTWHHLDAELLGVANKGKVLVAGHAVCLQAIGMAACEGNPVLVERIRQINLGEAEGFVIELTQGLPTSVDLIVD